ncbi:MAG TPA: tellurite resistance/C4-dicarboxylate transporter family protein, partial [Pyrinomonadaceae bacterium]|nr:tellurite resistance/C4-dicarboxylate transporter family protein [Pyrinomonadaceae bacterium]
VDPNGAEPQATFDELRQQLPGTSDLRAFSASQQVAISKLALEFCDAMVESPALLTPPYWINMGAGAITTLAGARLIIAGPSWSLLADLSPFLKGFTLFFWAAGTWWIPLLLILGFWRHVYKRFPLRYDPQYWGMVFPLGMYTVCTFQLAKAIDFPALLIIPRGFIYLALIGWLMAFAGLIHTLLFKPRTA